MTEITRVPIQPVAKGSLTKLWIGVILAVLVGAGLAWAAVPKGLDIDVIQAGTGPNPKQGEVVFVKYKGILAADGTVFEDAQTSPFPVPGLFPDGTPFLLEEGAMIPGFLQALQQVQKGGKYKIFIPAELGYGATPPPTAGIPANADLEFEIEVVEITTRASVERKIQVLQQTMQQQMGAAGGAAPGGAAPGGAPDGAAAAGEAPAAAAPQGAPQVVPGQ
ncbi:FKBP-type peptidyl-prolyl cis-trans isomerase [Erythrobacter sp. BLCC-B19]|uniref:FKBP-type peptidyl-prolyl cis-trans isomerase n=1 Tax=Erythrobacter sp. BLCC-B19 TaxID=3025315 RepID=UPI002360A733|nr:FKBP-type peptidyl-prolyl cis-trans isomerase [Erythrobacter sp. BLCC-B19]WDA41608.1 FKBP-type peptidyl-prolyl cis-trans isomerase [Erythrobacter sp. BLCC-B19]